MSSQIVECHNCGMQGQVGESCIKCNTQLYRSLTQPLYVIDIAHSGEDREDAIRKVIKGIEISIGKNHKVFARHARLRVSCNEKQHV